MISLPRPARVVVALFGGWCIVGAALTMLRGPASGDAVFVSTIAATLLACVLWWSSEHVPVPGRPDSLFLTGHAFGALAFGNAMVFVTYAVEAATRGRPFLEVVREARWLGAEFVFWIWLYGLLATAAYGSRMRRAVALEREAAVRAQARETEARLETLRAQLDPHFLFNALHGISALVQRDGERAEEALERLADLLRFSLDQVGSRLISLEHELRFTQTYVELERMGLGDRLRLDMDVDDRALRIDVPPFALQTLVENAIRHSVAPRPAGGYVGVSIRLCGDTLRIEVVNDGPVRVSEPGTGRGLRNLAARVEALYGAEATLTAASLPDEGFSALLTVPAS